MANNTLEFTSLYAPKLKADVGQDDMSRKAESMIQWVPVIIVISVRNTIVMRDVVYFLAQKG